MSLRPYAIEVTHVRGETNFLADNLSRHPPGNKEEFHNYTPFPLCNKSLRLMTSKINTKDFYLQQVSEGASKDPDYFYTIQVIRERLGTKEINNDSEAKKIEGQWELMGILETDKGKLVTRNNFEVLIPRGFCEDILTKLHAGHRGTEAMVLQARGKFFWPNMKSEIRNRFSRCEACLLHSPSKPDPPYNGLPGTSP